VSGRCAIPLKQPTQKLHAIQGGGESEEKAINITAAIFDIDGTLVDSVDLHAEAWRLAFKKFGKTVSFIDVRRQIGKGSDQLLPVFLTSTEMQSFGEELDAYRSELYKREFLPQVKPFAKTRELFECIRQDGKRIALASSAKEDELEKYKEIARIKDLVEVETSSADAAKSKPYPDIFEAALSALQGFSRPEVLVVGDTPYDAEAAARARLRSIGVLCGGWSEAELRSSGCIAIYADPADLLANYSDSPFRQPIRRNLC
jgi:HAD superfamily hydrolase (TIGR01549 family)